MYEYKVDRSAGGPVELEQKLNELAGDGWRLVSLKYPDPGGNGFRNPVGPIDIVLEREKA